MALKFYTNVTKGLKLKDRIWEITGGKPVKGGGFLQTTTPYHSPNVLYTQPE